MKLVSKASLGAALALGMIAAGVATPAFAKKAEKAAPQYAPQLSKEFRVAIGAAQNAVKGGNAADAAAKLAATLKDVRTVTIEGAGHIISEQPDAVLDALRAFIVA